ncbi:hypothetical protein CsatB_006260 [Cannabis sativa]
MEDTAPPQIDDESFSCWLSLINQLEISKEPRDLTKEDLLNKSLPTNSLWEAFYYSYSRWIGFSVRKHDVRKDTENNEWQRVWVCSRQGTRKNKWINLENRKRIAKPITRVGCPARIRVNLDRSNNTWVVRDFEPHHNHNLVLPIENQFLRSNRKVTTEIGEQVMSMRRSGIRTCHILNHLAQERGGQDYVPFQSRDLYNWIGDKAKSTETETDSEGALGYLECLARKDDQFYGIYSIDDQTRLANLFWCDGISRRDYQTFGDVLAFDTTYKTNAYKKPLLILVGVNHHFRTTVFGLALLCDESASTFIWVLQCFLDAMYNKPPSVVITDGDKAMREAINVVMPNAVHRLCAWHISTNASKAVPNPSFKTAMNHLLYHYYFQEEEWEQEWKSVMEKFGLQTNGWCQAQYETKRNWAETFLRGHFMAGSRTTQRSESTNSYLNQFLSSKLKLRDFIGQIDNALQKIRHNELEDDFKSNHSSPHIPRDVLSVYHEQFATYYTRNMYDKVAEQIKDSLFYKAKEIDRTTDSREFYLERFPTGLVRHSVTLNEINNHMKCTCLLFETDGIACRHLFAVMKNENIQLIPPSLIKDRWRKDAKTRINLNVTPHLRVPTDVLQTTRWGTLTSAFNCMAQYATKHEDTYEDAKKEIIALTSKFKNLCQQRQIIINDDEITTTRGEYIQRRIVQDPVIVKTKGREAKKGKAKENDNTIEEDFSRKQKRCRLCNQLGHNRSTCSYKEDPLKNTEDTSLHV